MEIVLLPVAQDQIQYWHKTNNKLVLKRFSMLIKAILIDPYRGIGKPEALKHELSGKWSRRIDKENRVVYSISDGVLYVYSLRGHYS